MRGVKAYRYEEGGDRIDGATVAWPRRRTEQSRMLGRESDSVKGAEARFWPRGYAVQRHCPTGTYKKAELFWVQDVSDSMDSVFPFAEDAVSHISEFLRKEFDESRMGLASFGDKPARTLANQPRVCYRTEAT